MDINKIYNMDCVIGMKSLESQSVDMILTDPPYGINLTPQRKNSQFKNTTVINDDNLQWLPECVQEWHRVLKPNSVAYVFCNWQNYDIFKQILSQQFTIKNCIVWDKDWFGIGNNWRPNHEFIIVATNGKFKTKSNNKSNIIKCRRLPSQRMMHSCEKPVQLLELLIIESCNEGDLILDCFAGSGSTMQACIKTNRNYIGYEIDEQYFNIANERIKNII